MAVSQAFGPTRVARGVAIETDYVPTVGTSAKYRPVRIAVVGVGQESKTYAFTKRDITTLAEVADVYGYKCPIYQAVKMLKPPIGVSVGDIPITVFPVEVNAINVGMVTTTNAFPLESQDMKTEKVTIDGGSEQTVTFDGAITDAADIAAQMDAQLTGCKVEVVSGAIRITSDTTGPTSEVVIGTGTTDLTWGTPAALGAKAAGSVAAVGTTTSTQTYIIRAGNSAVEVTLASGKANADFIAAYVAAAALVPDYPLTVTDGTTVATCTVGWEGATGNLVDISVESPDDADLTFTIVQPTGGAGTLDIDDALEQFGDTWYSHVVNCEIADETNYNKYSVANEARWEPGVYKPFKVYHGTAGTSVATAAAITDARKSDRTNSLKPVPGSLNLPWEIAARHVQALANVANVNAPRDYGSQQLTLLDDGGAENQWSEADGEFQYAVIRGLSTTKIKNGVLRVADSVMMYHPDGEDPPAYRYDCDIEKISAMIYNIDLIFNNDDVDGSPLPPDDAVVTNPSARKPMSYKSKLFQLYDVMERDAIIADADYAKENTIVEISGSNPKRMDVLAVYKLAGNANVISVTQNFSFYYGGE